MLKQYGWDTLEQRRLLHQLSMFYKIQQCLVGISLPSEVCLLQGLLEPPMHFFFDTFKLTVMFTNIRFTQVQ